MDDLSAEDGGQADLVDDRRRARALRLEVATVYEKELALPDRAIEAYEAVLAASSRIADIYGSTTIHERHRHRYEVNTGYREPLEKVGLTFAGMSPDGLLPETCERADHPWFVGVQYHPELKSRPFEPHPLFKSFIAAAVEQRRLV